MRKIICCGLALVIILMSMSGCAVKDYPVTVGKLTVESPVQGIVSMSPVVTAALVELGLNDRLVAVGTGCQYPPYTDGLQTVGTVDHPNGEKMAELSAKIVFMAGDKIPSTMSSVEKSGIKVACLPIAMNMEDIEKSYRDVASSIKGANLGEYLAKNYIKNISDQLEAVKLKEEKTYLYILSDKGYVAPTKSVESDMLSLVGLKNVVSEKDGFTPSADLIKKYNPDYIFISKEVNAETLKTGEIFSGMKIISDGKTIVLDNRNMVTGHLSAAVGDIMAAMESGAIK